MKVRDWETYMMYVYASLLPRFTPFHLLLDLATSVCKHIVVQLCWQWINIKRQRMLSAASRESREHLQFTRSDQKTKSPSGLHMQASPFYLHEHENKQRGAERKRGKRRKRKREREGERERRGRREEGGGGERGREACVVAPAHSISTIQCERQGSNMSVTTPAIPRKKYFSAASIFGAK